MRKFRSIDSFFLNPTFVSAAYPLVNISPTLPSHALTSEVTGSAGAKIVIN